MHGVYSSTFDLIFILSQFSTAALEMFTPSYELSAKEEEIFAECFPSVGAATAAHS